MAQIGQNIKQLYFLLSGRNPHFLIVVLRNPGVEPTARQLITDLTFPFGSWFSGGGFYSGRFPPRPAPPGVSPRPPSRHCALRSWPRGRGRRSSASHSVLVTGDSSAHGVSVPPWAECGVPRPHCHVHAATSTQGPVPLRQLAGMGKDHLPCLGDQDSAGHQILPRQPQTLPAGHIPCLLLPHPLPLGWASAL